MTANESSSSHHRRSTRLKGYDYSQAGAYFVTLCTFQMKPLFGSIVDGDMHLSEIGRIVEREWLRTPQIRRNVVLGVHAILPNHIHGILFIQDHSFEMGAALDPALQKVGASPRDVGEPSQALRSTAQTLGAIMRGFKGASTKQINLSRQTIGAPVWHRNYHDHVIRNDADMQRIWEYIMNNVQRWAEDRFHRE
jgi:hypothetical protein